MVDELRNGSSIDMIGGWKSSIDAAREVLRTAPRHMAGGRKHVDNG
jgi:hypothetical protein